MTNIIYSKKHNIIIATKDTYYIHIYDTNGRKCQTIDLSNEAAINKIVLSPNEDLLFAILGQTTIVYEIISNNGHIKIKHIKNIDQSVRDIIFKSKGHILFGIRSDYIYVWDISKLYYRRKYDYCRRSDIKLLFVLYTDTIDNKYFVLSDDKNTLYITTYWGEITIWDVSYNKLIEVERFVENNKNYSLAYFAGKDFIRKLMFKGKISLYHSVYSISYVNNYLFVACNQRILICDIIALSKFIENESESKKPNFSNVVLQENKCMKQIDINIDQRIKQMIHIDNILYLVLDTFVLSWDIKTEELSFRINMHYESTFHRIEQTIITPNNKYCFIRTKGDIYICDLSTGQVQYKIKGEYIYLCYCNFENMILTYKDIDGSNDITNMQLMILYNVDYTKIIDLLPLIYKDQLSVLLMALYKDSDISHISKYELFEPKVIKIITEYMEKYK